MRPAELPPSLGDSPFSTREALDLGVPAKRLRAKDLLTPHHGVRTRGAPAVSVIERAHALLPRLAPLQVFSHATAMGIFGAPLPPGAHRTLHVGALCGTREPRIAGVTGHRLALDPGEVGFVEGMPVPAAAEAWAQLGAFAAGRRTGPPLRLEDLVAAADHLLTNAITTHQDLIDAAESPRRRGALLLREAAALARTGAESPKESEVRFILHWHRLPEPELNWVLRNAASRFVARLDLAYPRYRVAVEYDGRHHAEDAQFARDADRWAAIEAEGWVLVRVLSHHLAEPHGIAARVRRALRSRGWPG